MPESPWISTRVWSLASTADEIDRHRDHSRGLVGETIASVRYLTIDYFRDVDAPESVDTGPRTAVEGLDRQRSVWRHDGFDAVDFGVDLTTVSGGRWSFTWDPPSDPGEGVGLRAQPLLGTAFPSTIEAAVWDVSGHGPWEALRRHAVTDVELRYRPWADGSPEWWCRRITLTAGDVRLEVILGDADVGHGRLTPAADNLAVIHPGTALPDWAR